MERPNPYKDRIEKLECHFKWRPESGGKDDRIESIMEKTDVYLELNTSLRLPNLALHSYLYTLKSPQMDFKKALDIIEEAKSLEEAAGCLGGAFVLSANELHIKYLRRNEDEELLSRLEEEWSGRGSKPEWEAAVWGAKGYAMTRCGVQKYEEGASDYQKAIDLEPQNAYWYFGKAFLLEKMRLRNTSFSSKPSKEELDLFKMAQQMTDQNNAVYASFYGKALSDSYSHNRQGWLSREMWNRRKECLEIVEFVLQTTGGNHWVYRNCSKVYKRFRMFDNQRVCLMQGVEKCKLKAELYHNLAMFYWCDSEYRDLALAKEYMQKSMVKGQEHYWLESNLLKVKLEIDISFDPLDDFARLERKYGKDPVFIINLHKERGMYLMEKKRNKLAVEDFLKAVELQSNQIHGQVFLEREKIETFLAERITNGGINEQKDFARFFQKCYPQTDDCLNKSAECYREILKSNPSDEFTVTNLGDVLIRLKKFNEAIDVLDSRCTSLKIQKILCEAFLKSAQLADSIDVKEEYFRRCMALKCSNGAIGLFNILKEKAKLATNFQLSLPIYRESATIFTVLRDPLAYSLEIEPNGFDSRTIQMGIRELLGLDIEGPLRTLRQLRFEMSCDPDKKKIDLVLAEARRQLDIVHKQLVIRHFPKGKPYCYFPLAVKTDVTDREKVKKELVRLVQTPNHGGWANFDQIQHHRFEPLVNFMAEKQVAGSRWLKGWFALINIHKHERDLTPEDYQLKQTLENPSSQTAFGDALELAHQSAEFTEQICAEYLKYL